MSCIGGEVCFTVELDALTSDNQISYLPVTQTVNCRFIAPLWSGQQPDHKDFTLELELENASGLYKGFFCESDYFQSEAYIGYPYKLKVSTPIDGAFDTGSQFNPQIFSNTIEIYFFENLGFQVAPRCLPADNGEHIFAQSLIYGVNCPSYGKIRSSHYSINIAAEYIEIRPDFGIEIKPSSSANTGSWFAINPCIEVEKPQLNEEKFESTFIQDERANEIKNNLVVDKAILEIYPNPFTDEININYFIPENCIGNTSISLFSVTGSLIGIIQKLENCSEGNHQIKYNASQLAPGLYFYELKTCNNQRVVRKAVKIANR